MFFYFESTFIEKFLRLVFQILAQIEMKRNKKIGHLAAILKWYNILKFLLQNYDFYSAYIYGANFIATFRWKVVFCGWVPRTPHPLGHQRE